ncbi:MAG: protein kinase, partial [Planctomycetes bacterium]|nr:protein kinase [Planctomycetota bacterium]
PLLLEKRIAAGVRMLAALPVAGGGAGAARGASPTVTVRARAAAGAPAAPLADADAARKALQRGERLAEFRIERVIGQGGMGTVYEALDTSLQRTVALKVLAEEQAGDRDIVERFQREAQAAAALAHPNITQIYSIGAEGDRHFFAMELVIGQTLAELVQEQGRIAEEDAIDYLIQISRGLRAANNKRIIHRDLKPSNLILSSDGLVKITDFGLAKVVSGPADITAAGIIMGTPLYMSPEQSKGEPLDHRSDIYSLGCSFFHLLEGRPPYDGDSAMNIIVKHITEPPPEIEGGGETRERLGRALARMMAKDPIDRFQGYEELIEAVSPTPGSASSTRLEQIPGRVVLVSEAGEENLHVDPLSLKQISVADVNMELGRHEKALALYRSVIESNPQLESELSFRMLKIHQQRGDETEVARLLQRILDHSADPAERFFCRYKLLARHYRSCLEEVRAARASLVEILGEAIPNSVSAKRLRQRLAALEELEERLERDGQGGVVLVRRSGDLQIELD